jgi:hypothetical protein
MQPFSTSILRAISIAMTVAGILLRDTMHEDEDLGHDSPWAAACVSSAREHDLIRLPPMQRIALRAGSNRLRPVNVTCGAPPNTPTFKRHRSPWPRRLSTSSSSFPTYLAEQFTFRRAS